MIYSQLFIATWFPFGLFKLHNPSYQLNAIFGKKKKHLPADHRSSSGQGFPGRLALDSDMVERIRRASGDVDQTSSTHLGGFP
jgi:hypothetical protein